MGRQEDRRRRANQKQQRPRSGAGAEAAAPEPPPTFELAGGDVEKEEGDEEEDSGAAGAAVTPGGRGGGGRTAEDTNNSAARRLPQKPSYDYDELVRQVSHAFSLRKWDECCGLFQSLSEHCPMTPLLWLQYSHAAGQAVAAEDGNGSAVSSTAAAAAARAVQNDVLELALLEFPASTVLHTARIRILACSRGTSWSPFDAAMAQALDAVGRGSHPTDPLVSELYRIRLWRLLDGWDEMRRERDEEALRQREEEIRECLRGWARNCSPANGDVLNQALDVKGLVAYVQLQQSLKRDPAEDKSERPRRSSRGTRLEDGAPDLAAGVAEPANGAAASGPAFAAPAFQDVPPEVRCILSEWLEGPRRDAFRHYQDVRGFEDEISIAMERLGIAALLPDDTDEGGGGKREEGAGAEVTEAWTRSDASTAAAGMGLGDAELAKVFVRYSRHLMKRSTRQQRQRRELEREDDEDSEPTDSSCPLALQVLERGIVECPTVELLWVHYVELLRQLVGGDDNGGDGARHEPTNEQHRAQLSGRLDGVLTRAVRNCPYSLRLATLRITSQLLLARHGATVVDPEALLDQAHASLRSGFLTSAAASASTRDDPNRDDDDSAIAARTVSDVYHSVLWVVKQRILFLLAAANPGAVWPATGGQGSGKKKDPPVSSLVHQQGNRGGGALASLDVPEEAGDLLEDLADLHDEMDKTAFQLLGHSQAAGVVRSGLWRDGSLTLRLLLQPLARQQRLDEASETLAEVVQSLQWTERALKMRNPPHPDLFREYLDQIRIIPNMNVLQKLHLLRATFSRAVRSVGRSAHHSHRYNQYDVSLRQLCHEWVDFESRWGSLESMQQARQATHKKLSSAETETARATVAPLEGSARHKRAHESLLDLSPEALNEEPGAKRTKLTDQPKDNDADGLAESQVPSESPAEASAMPKKQGSYKVRVGKLDFPAHPYTVRVSNLTLDTEDMDLVDTFRRCGAIVHARIVRDKSQFNPHQGGRHPVPPSKGYGLVQFEERDSVEAALALNDVIGLKERVLKVERSHIPSALIVPPGMHRVNEKGHGKYSKRNERRKETAIVERDGAGLSRQDPSGSDAAVETRERKETTVSNPSLKGTGASKLPAAQSVSVLSFLPRGVARGGHQKARLALPESKKS